MKIELWLGEDDSRQSALHLFADPAKVAKDLLAVAAANEGLTGFNIDLETAHSTPADAQLSVPFLREVTATLNAHQPPLRFSTDVACSLGNDGWCPMIDNCALVASSGVNRIMHMGTYNAASYQAWVQRALAPAIAPGVPRASVGLGLGVWSKRSSPPSSISRSLKRGAVHTRQFGGGRESVESGPVVGQRADLLRAQPQLCGARPVHTLTGRPGPDQELSRTALDTGAGAVHGGRQLRRDGPGHDCLPKGVGGARRRIGVAAGRRCGLLHLV